MFRQGSKEQQRFVHDNDATFYTQKSWTALLFVTCKYHLFAHQ